METILRTTDSTESNVAEIQTAAPDGTGEKAMQHTMASSGSEPTAAHRKTAKPVS